MLDKISFHKHFKFYSNLHRALVSPGVIFAYTGGIKKCLEYKIASELDICGGYEYQQQPTATAICKLPLTVHSKQRFKRL